MFTVMSRTVLIMLQSVQVRVHKLSFLKASVHYAVYIIYIYQILLFITVCFIKTNVHSDVVAFCIRYHGNAGVHWAAARGSL